MKNKNVFFKDLGVLDYKVSWDYQENLFKSVIEKKLIKRESGDSELPTPNYLLFVEHPHVFTLGKSGDEKNLLVNEFELENRDASFYKINRGGDITYHGPGQLVAYPILDLDNFFTDIHLYLRNLEECVILTLKDYGITAERSKGETGVWLDAADKIKARKICAMGVRCSRWVTMHGLGFNINSDLSYFNHIIPCGIVDKKVTSMENELGHKVDLNEVKEKLKTYFEKIFECTLQNEN
jgi:lipoyl(octanoyl) transferase